jgi:S-adenosylmethionine:tRNA ribosyltransferase-isomerase
VRTEDLDFELPEELVARRPAQRREDARLMVVRGASAPPEHRRFADLPGLLRAGDLLVVNDTRVLRARLLLRKSTGGAVEGLYLRALDGRDARCMLSGSRLRPGVELGFAAAGEGLAEAGTAGGELSALRLEEKLEPGVWRVRALHDDWEALLAGHGAVPLPPYVRRLRHSHGEAEEESQDAERYQTVWAERAGSVAAPTASLHFRAPLLEALDVAGVERAPLTLHVGRGTFLPVESETLEAHAMHAERFEVPEATATAIERTRASGGRVVAAGTTVCRALEAWAGGERQETRLMIAPGHRFRVVDALLTNFHTPRSTLLALVAGFAERIGATDGLARVQAAYAEAVRERYRFFSYGDASLWLPGEDAGRGA